KERTNNQYDAVLNLVSSVKPDLTFNKFKNLPYYKKIPQETKTKIDNVVKDTGAVKYCDESITSRNGRVPFRVFDLDYLRNVAEDYVNKFVEFVVNKCVDQALNNRKQEINDHNLFVNVMNNFAKNQQTQSKVSGVNGKDNDRGFEL
ncbi:hypothetical protein JDW15_10530, partial [Aerococcaceae bacterium zg-ZJ1578]|uniref:hypothetical protein n=1 Tax=Aerococcaceae bacterium zg-252 TaxID=2796928 RepID=UPI001A33EA0B|nr:hypothetical protein [Aerococcaceae bacterium zg-1578]